MLDCLTRRRRAHALVEAERARAAYQSEIRWRRTAAVGVRDQDVLVKIKGPGLDRVEVLGIAVVERLLRTLDERDPGLDGWVGQGRARKPPPARACPAPAVGPSLTGGAGRGQHEEDGYRN